jgi:WD40 repeat protein
VGGDKISGDISAKGVSGSGHHIGHRIYKDPDYPYDVRGLDNPYLGLAAFTYAERAKYAGRERVVEQAVELLTTPGEQRTLLFITGASGSGKSSLAQAGLLPALEQHYGSDNLYRAVFRPSRHPIDSLLDALQRQVGLPIQTLERDQLPQAFATFLGQHIPSPQVLALIIDQFEELFSQADHAQRDQLFALLTSLPPFADLRAHVIATVRADYLPELFAHQALYDEAKRGIDLRVMTEDALRQAIQQPLIQHPDAKDKRFEDALLNRLASDAAADAAYLPLLQVTLARIWSGGLLKLSAYGTLTDAIQQQAEEVYTYRPDGPPRPEAEQQAILALLLELVDVSPTSDDRRDVRRRRLLSELLHAAPERRLLVTELATARLLSTGRETRAGAEVEVVDIIHESLLVNWARLKQAIDAERETLQQRARFEMALHEWQVNEQQDVYLLTGVRLSEAEALDIQGDVALRNPVAQELLKRSVTQREERRKRELRRVQMVAVVLTVLLLLAGGAAWWAVDRQQVAEQQADIATSRQLAAQSVSQQESDPRLALLLAVQSDAITNTSESYSSLLSGLQFSPHLSATLTNHTDEVTSVAFSPDRQTLASSSRDETIILWDVASGEGRLTLRGHASRVESVAFSPDGQSLASASCGAFDEEQSGRCVQGEIILWDVASGARQATLQGHTDLVTSVAFSPDGQTLASGSGSGDGSIILWEVTTRQSKTTLKGHTWNVSSVAFSPDGHTLASSGGVLTEPGEIILWDLETRQRYANLEGHASRVNSVAFSPDGQTLASGSVDDSIILWNVASGKPIGQPLAAHTSFVLSVSFSPDGKTLVSGDRNKTIILWDITTEARVEEQLQGHIGSVNSVAFSPDGQTLASGSVDDSIILWDVASEAQSATLQGHTDLVTSVAFSPDGQTLASVSSDETIRLWDVASREQQSTLQGHTDAVWSVAFSPDGQSLASASCGAFDEEQSGRCVQGEIILWDVASGARQATLQGHTDLVTSVAFSPDGQTLASGSHDDSIILWDVASGKPISQPLQSPVDNNIIIVFSPYGQTVASGSPDDTITLWDATTGQSIGQPLQASIDRHSSIAFSSDGQFLAAANCARYESGGDVRVCLEGKITLWDMVTSEKIQVFTGHTSSIRDVVFSPDGMTIASSSSDGTIRLWEVTTSQPLGSFLIGHTHIVTSMAFSPDGMTLAAGSADGSIILWDVSVDSWKARACRAAGRNLSAEEWQRYLGDRPYELTCPDLPPHPSAVRPGMWDEGVNQE